MLKKLQTLQKLLVELNQMICLVMETPAKLLDRFDKLVLGIKAIDATQLPTELQLITILKNAISDKFKLLNAMLLTTANLTLLQLREKLLNWETRFEVGGRAKETGTRRQVVNFAGTGYGNQKKSFVRKLKSDRHADQANFGEKAPIICWDCQQEGHLKRDCPQSTNSGSSFGRKRGGGSGYDSESSASGNNLRPLVKIILERIILLVRAIFCEA